MVVHAPKHARKLQQSVDMELMLMHACCAHTFFTRPISKYSKKRE